MINFKNLLARKSLLEYSTEIAIILASLALLGFFKLTEEVIEGETLGFDQRVLLWFRNPADLSDPTGPAWLEVVMRDMTALGGVLILGLLTIAACGYLWLSQRHKLAIFVAISIPTGSLVNSLLKGFFERPRPNIVPHATDAALSSFPSGHAMMSTVVFLTLGALLSLSTNDNRIKIYILCWSILLTILVGISRLYLGVHWPTDILAGWLAGAVWALLCLLAGNWILRRKV
ncbi:MAG: phosphatase PAP2 family protein [Pseudomonadota bacterium]|nr:phosphatase PAP2 family protein [Pseudomonadota bacterium]